jgi:hypothetical protein
MTRAARSIFVFGLYLFGSASSESPRPPNRGPASSV